MTGKKIKLSKELKIGIVTISTLLIFIWLTNFLLSKDFFHPEKKCYAIYDDVDGLSPSDPVVMKGMKIGKVRKMFFTSPQNPKIVVTFYIDDKIEIPENSIATISGTILGSKSIIIVPGNAKSLIKSGDTLASCVEDGLTTTISKQLEPLKARTENMLNVIDTMLHNLNTSINYVENITYNVDNLMTTEKNKIADIINNFEAISATLKANHNNITTIMSNFSAISDSIAKINISQTIASLNTALSKTNSALGKIEKGEGSLGLLINDDKLYKQLDSASNSLDKLLKDIQKNPKRYVSVSVFGKKDK